ncbi:CRAL/TRIO domain-containing protein [Skeletonema marinoi]|uniref:CRAL/TRIO domain-containing protein n=1 Tax=Skeletonema marinoi TaxID=267567 RepID=A0AAD9DC78_9STRA|nr:CRAL/TRIO domain-containing protein [Skeletonema marinoi]
MNHLCGLPHLNNDDSQVAIHPYEQETLAAFRQRFYDSAPPIEEYRSNNIIAHYNADAGEEKKDSSSHGFQYECDETNLISRRVLTPQYTIPHDKLPPSGWRPLDDCTLYRFLLADRQKDGIFDTEASFQRLMAALQFRREYRSDVIVHNIWNNLSPPAHVQKCKAMRVAIWAGTDYNSRPVVFERLGQFFSSGNAALMTEEEWEESYLYFLETHFCRMRQISMNSGVAVDRIVYFADFSGVVTSIMNRKIWKVIPLLKRLVKKVESHYPEIVDHITLFNVPTIASAAYKVVRGFLDPVTADKIELFSGVPLERFNELMGENVIPKEYGGRNDCDYPQTL